MKTPLRLLLVDDDLGDIQIIARAIRLSKLEAECTSASDFPGALAKCEEKTFDCAIVDYQLPGHDGLQALLDFGERFPNMPLVMSTGHGDELVATEAMKRGAADYIRKGDITSSSIRRVIENAVEKVQLRRKLAEQQRELERFADILVHDLRAPSSSIQTFIMYLQEDISAGKMGMVPKYCEFALRAAARMDTLISTLFQYTRLDGEVAFEPVSMNAALDSALANLHNVIRLKHAQVTHDDLPAVIGSASLLEQLLQNLVSNGIKYCKREVPRIHIGASLQTSGAWLFCVQDNGIGIPAGDRARIFESFTRLHGIGEYEGTGLGLATCAKIVIRHGGCIYCDSTEGEGTTFFFTLLPAIERADASETSDSLRAA